MGKVERCLSGLNYIETTIYKDEFPEKDRLVIENAKRLAYQEKANNEALISDFEN